jgi:hypothetical protein
MKRTWTIIGVRDVRTSFKWYQALFGQAETPAAHADFGVISDSDGTVLLCLHEWGAHEHQPLMSPEHGTPGNGLLAVSRRWFCVACAGRRCTRTLHGPFREARRVSPLGGAQGIR